jgi:hypothetical protein
MTKTIENNFKVIGSIPEEAREKVSETMYKMQEKGYLLSKRSYQRAKDIII